MHARVILIVLVVGLIPWSGYGTTYYVWTNSPSDGPGTNWVTAFHVIQAAVGIAHDGDTVMATNGVYDRGGALTPGGLLTNRIVMTNGILVQSVNGPEVTIIQGKGPQGDDAVRCAFLTNGATLAGFTLTKGFTRLVMVPEPDGCGGAAYAMGGMLTNCILSSSKAQWAGGVMGGTLLGCRIANNWAYMAGGVYFTTAIDCDIVGNSCDHYGGGASDSALDKCRITANYAHERGGGAYNSTLKDCLISSNQAPGGADYRGGGAGAHTCTLLNCVVTRNIKPDFRVASGLFNCIAVNCSITRNISTESVAVWLSQMTNCIAYGNDAYQDQDLSLGVYSCTTPDPGGEGNITNAPQFVDPDAGNFHLTANSPCINAGTNGAIQPGETDLDGLPRVIGGRVDMGAYESTNGMTTNGLPWGWLLNYGIETDGSADGLDLDGDGSGNDSEYMADTDPTNADSVLKFLAVGPQWGGMRLDWKGGRDAWQFLECREDLADTNETWLPLLGLPPPTPVTNAVIDMGATNRTLFYRIRAER